MGPLPVRSIQNIYCWQYPKQILPTGHNEVPFLLWNRQCYHLTLVGMKERIATQQYLISLYKMASKWLKLMDFCSLYPVSQTSFAGKKENTIKVNPKLCAFVHSNHQMRRFCYISASSHTADHSKVPARCPLSKSVIVYKHTHTHTCHCDLDQVHGVCTH